MPGFALAVVLIGIDPVLVTVTVSGITVVAGATDSALVVPGITDPLTVVASMVVPGMVLASRVVPSTVDTATVGTAPNSLPGMAVPTPELVHCVGISIVLRFGLEPPSSL